MDIAGYRLSEPQNICLLHARILYGPATAYACCTHVGLLSNGCSATGPFAVKEGKMLMLRIASLLLFVPLFFLFLFLCLSLSCLKSYPFMELKCTEEGFYLVRL